MAVLLLPDGTKAWHKLLAAATATSSTRRKPLLLLISLQGVVWVTEIWTGDNTFVYILNCTTTRCMHGSPGSPQLAARTERVSTSMCRLRRSARDCISEVVRKDADDADNWKCSAPSNITCKQGFHTLP
jgi:hypothetical protein